MCLHFYDGIKAVPMKRNTRREEIENDSGTFLPILALVSTIAGMPAGTHASRSHLSDVGGVGALQIIERLPHSSDLRSQRLNCLFAQLHSSCAALGSRLLDALLTPAA